MQFDAASLIPTSAPEDSGYLDVEIASEIRNHLLEVGPEQFYNDTILVGKYSRSVLGTAFGLAPYLVERLEPEIFERILEQVVLRFFNKRQKLPQYNTIDDAAELLRKSDKIMVITGAGISTSLGIPDFRSKGTGFYSQLLAEGISEPEEVFDIYEFDNDPRTFYKLAHGILPDEARFSPTHGFIRLLQDKGKLQTNYTQNIDNIEERAGIDRHRLIQCHGSFASATCRKCGFQVKGTDIFPDIRAQRVARCKRCIEDLATKEAAPKKKQKSNYRHHHSGEDDSDEDDDILEPGVMKPDITFFGEQLPETFFHRLTAQDAKDVDLVLVIGTSLKVAPVSEIPNYLPHQVPHIYISREPIEHVNFDVQLLGQCDAVVSELCRRVGWELKHEMIPPDFAVSVEEFENSGHRWIVRAKEDEDRAEVPTANGEDPVTTMTEKSADETPAALCAP